ncbi:MAG: hypothetical protein NTV21_09310 [Planctomycetota bacterium]|nr:hypothetical protein [Planctomycetota bacterium]
MTAPTPFALLSPLSVRLPALWVLGVASIKMFGGSPNDIPEFLRTSFLGPDMAFFGAIMVELSFALVALVFPRWGWMLMSALYAVFLGVLTHLIATGAASCGCFGGAVSLSPASMMAIDGSFLALMLATRPWRAIPKGPTNWLVVALLAGLGAAAPWILVENEQIEVPAPVQVPPTPAASAPASNDTTNGAGAGSQQPDANNAGTPPPAVAVGAWRLPEKFPQYVHLRPPEWVGKSIHETQLAVWMDTRAYPEDATWILYLETCSHCAEYLKQLEANFANDPKVYVFVRLSTDKDEVEQVVHIKPPGEQAALPKETSWVVSPQLPPWELVLEGGIVRSATAHGDE